MKKVLATPALTGEQISIVEIPRQLYQHFYAKRIGDEMKTETNGEIRLWFELPTDDKNKVVAVFTELDDDDAMETKFGLITWYPPEEQFMHFYDFEVLAVLKSRQWSYGDGNRFVETLLYRTQDSLIANHPLADYAALALIEMRNLLKNPLIVCQEFIDHAKKPPR